MPTYTLIFQTPDGMEPSGDSAGIQAILESANLGIELEFHPYYQVTTMRSPLALEHYLEGFFEANADSGPTRIIQGDLATAQQVMDMEANDPRHLARRRLDEALNNHLTTPTSNPLSVSITTMYFTALDIAKQLVEAERYPDKLTLESQIQTLSSQQVGLIERWVNLQADKFRLGKMLGGPMTSYYNNPLYQGTVGCLNLVVTDVIHTYLTQFAPTDPKDGELLEDGDQATYDRGWELINFIDGELDR